MKPSNRGLAPVSNRRTRRICHGRIRPAGRVGSPGRIAGSDHRARSPGRCGKFSRFGDKPAREAGLVVPREGLEPSRAFAHWYLKPACLPISAPRQRHPGAEGPREGLYTGPVPRSQQITAVFPSRPIPCLPAADPASPPCHAVQNDLFGAAARAWRGRSHRESGAEKEMSGPAVGGQSFEPAGEFRAQAKDHFPIPHL